MLAWIAAAALGAAVGLAEMVSRYRDEPADLPRAVSFWVYLMLNAAASGFAFWLIQVFGWTFGASNGRQETVTQVLVAGISAMALFRSSLLMLKIGNDEVGIGPSVLLTNLLSVVDRAVDRRRAKARSAAVIRAMDGVSFEKARLSLPAYCLQLMQNVPVDEQQRLRTSIDALELVDMDDGLKALNLGLLLMNTVGPDVLETAVDDLKTRIRQEPPTGPDASP